MMDFLRRLALPREGDTTRAVAALPSRFARESPLRSASVFPTGNPTDQDEGLPESWVAPSPPVGIQDGGESAYVRRVASTKGVDRPGIEQRVAGLPPLDMPGPARVPLVYQGHHESMTPRSPLRPQAANTESEDADQVSDPRSGRAQYPASAAFAAEAIALSAPASGTRRAAAPLIGAPRPAAAMSEGALAARVTQPEEQEAVVHVSIGRIEVTAINSPAPARAASSRPPRNTVSLADYLRNGSGRRT